MQKIALIDFLKKVFPWTSPQILSINMIAKHKPQDLENFLLWNCSIIWHIKKLENFFQFHIDQWPSWYSTCQKPVHRKTTKWNRVKYDVNIKTGLNGSWIRLNLACYLEYFLLLVESAPKYCKNDEMSIFPHHLVQIYQWY